MTSPFIAARDFEGFTHRDLFGTTILNRHEGGRFAVTATTGLLAWKTEDATDLDYTPLPLLRRNNAEEAFQFTQEVRVASAANAPARLSDSAALRWQAGVFFFTQNYEQNAVNSFAPFLLSPFVPVRRQPAVAGVDAGRQGHRPVRPGHGGAAARRWTSRRACASITSRKRAC